MTTALASELNRTIQEKAPEVFEMLSGLGRELYFPKGILTQSAEAKQKAGRHNATIGIARQDGAAMHLPSVMRRLAALSPDEALPYAPSPGLPALRAKWREHIQALNPSLDKQAISLPVVTGGVTHGLSLAADLFVDAGDAVMIPDKFWGNYNMIFRVRREARMVKYPFFAASGGLDTAGFAAAVAAQSGRGKIVALLNFPNNPTGYAPTAAEAQAVCEALTAAAEKGCRVVTVCDDAYFGLFYEPEVMRESVFARLAGKHPRLLAVKLDGATKEDFVWGLRVAFITFAAHGGAPVHDALEKKAGGCIRGTVSNCSQASQNIVLQAMNDPAFPAERQAKFEVLRARAARVKQALAGARYASAWTPYPFNSGYFMCLRLKDLNAEAYRLRLLDRYGIGVIATAPTDIRVAFSCIEEDEIADLFECMFRCAREMAEDPGGVEAVPDSAFEE
ncbi:MAG: aminotransferase class I/II-fold pyridoxal phosphate-dependent enzyme [Lentisphaerae bacterium]|nr:aminotransferase class I/II-fold pyridoxal phosphate-dependent enzyme [Lentisphaerota bacterium]